MTIHTIRFLLLWLLGNVICLASDPTTEAKLFVNQCLKDSSTFVVNPPATMNPYEGMSQNEIQKAQINAIQNGSVLALYPNGLPLTLISRKEMKLEGVSQSWHPNAITRTEEFYTEEKLDSGRYFNESGTLIATVENGDGIQIVYHRSKAEIRSTCEYQNGLKHGLETTYHNYSEGAKQSEAQYVDGKLHGIQRNWMPTGELNSEIHYQNGKQHGSSTNWHRNGNVQSMMQYTDGESTGKWQRFYENGVKQFEYEARSRSEWYPSGQLLFQKKYGEHGILANGKSYDTFGIETGSVINGVGTLVIGKDLDDRFSKMQLELYSGKRNPTHIQLPGLFNGAALGGKRPELTLMLKIKAPDNADISSGAIRLILPTGVHTSSPTQFDVPALDSGYSLKLENVDLQLPAPENEWNGNVLADVQLMIKGRSIRYIIPIYQSALQKPFKQVAQTKPAKVRKPKAYSVSLEQLSRQKEAPVIAGVTLSPFKQASMAVRLGKQIWVLYQDPNQIITSVDNGSSWTSVRKPTFGYCEYLHVIDGQTLLLWSTGATETPHLGIPHRVELSKDAGTTWETLKTPKLDMLIQVSMMNDVLILVGINIPSSGLPDEKDIYELPRTAYSSVDFTHFNAQPNSFWTNIETIRKKSLAPNGSAQVFFADASFLDSCYILYWSDRPDQIPRRVLSPHAFEQLVWSNNSKAIAVKRKDKFIAYYNRKTRDAKEFQLPYERPTSQKDQDDLKAFDLQIRQLMEANGGIFESD